MLYKITEEEILAAAGLDAFVACNTPNPIMQQFADDFQVPEIFQDGY